MDRATFAWLLSPEGQQALALAAELPLDDASHLSDLAHLRRTYSPPRAAAVLETARCRKRAMAKFSRAAQMYFTREALEQASGEQAAAHTAARFRGFEWVADVCCGIGGDTLALAQQARVIAFDRDPLRLAMARANVAAYGLLDRVHFVCADVDQYPLPRVEAVFADPARRSGGRRRFRLADYQPPFARIERWAASLPVGVKVAPGVGDEEIPPGWEVEFIAVGKELKEAVLWSDRFRTARRRATVLPDGDSLASRGDTDEPIAQGEPAGVLYEPNPALIRAHVLAGLAARLGAWQIDPTIAYLCAPRLIGTPLARGYPVEEWFPFNLKELNRRLRARGVGHVIVKKRGSPLDPQALEQRLRLAGAATRVVVLTRVAGKPAIIVCHPPPDEAPASPT